MTRYDLTRQANLQTIKDRGLELISDWDGRRAIGAKSAPLLVTVRNPTCGHVFTSTAVNLLSRGITCAVCGKRERAKAINAWSKQNSEEWQKTADVWKRYRADVTRHTRVTYRDNKQLINPRDLPTGRAGTKGAYHLDHIVPVRWCFERNVPANLVADVSNLQMLRWRENISKRNHVIGEVSTLFKPFDTLVDS